jgi:flagellar protein FliL
MRRAQRAMHLVCPLPFPCAPPAVCHAGPAYDQPDPNTMSEPQTPAAEAGAAKPKRLPLIILAVAGLLIGVLGGAFVAVPLFAKKATAAAPAKDSAHGTEGGKDSTSAARSIYTVDNVVLNPAGTGGTRFLMITVAFELDDAKYEESMKEKDAEIRDLIVSLFAKKTVDQLAEAALRDGFRAEAVAAVSPLLPKKAIRRVFFPQFVIQ